VADGCVLTDCISREKIQRMAAEWRNNAGLHFRARKQCIEMVAPGFP